MSHADCDGNIVTHTGNCYASIDADLKQALASKARESRPNVRCRRNTQAAACACRTGLVLFLVVITDSLPPQRREKEKEEEEEEEEDSKMVCIGGESVSLRTLMSETMASTSGSPVEFRARGRRGLRSQLHC